MICLLLLRLKKIFENKYNVENKSISIDRNIKNIKLLEK